MSDLREAARLGVFLGQVKLDGSRLGQHDVAIDQHRDLGRGVEVEERRSPCLALHEVDRAVLVLKAQLVEQPDGAQGAGRGCSVEFHRRSEEHTSELQSLMRSSYAVFCLKKNNNSSMN